MSIVSSELARKLLSGKVICKWSEPLDFEHLTDQSVFDEFDRSFRFLGVQLLKTDSGQGFYLINKSDTRGAKAMSREFFRSVMIGMRPTLMWLDIFMELLGRDQLIHSGADFSFSELHTAVVNDMGLQETLSRMPSSKGESEPRKQIDGLIKQLKKDEVLIDVNAGQERYRFTAKIDLINEYILFIQESEGIPIEESTETQPRLSL